MSKSVTILGSTGTIGQNTLSLIQDDKKISVEALTARSNVSLLAEQAKKFNAKIAVIEDQNCYEELKSALAGTTIEAACGSYALVEAAQRDVDVLISGIVGAAALAPTLAAIEKGTTIGLANKECLVCAGDLMMEKVHSNKAQLIPVDSEHNSLYQAFNFNQPKAIEKITLTASGGPFRKKPIEEFSNITPKQAITHPNWDMGAKISVDSATMMNKGLEVIEAYHLFPVTAEQIDIVVHPQSIIHGMVHYVDGSILAGMSTPDMRVPISYALGWPDYMPTTTARLDLTDIGKLTFEKPDREKFPALNLAKSALKTGGNAPCILNAANEIAVENFLSKKISFLQIINVVEQTLLKMRSEKLESLQHVFETDKQARMIAADIVNHLNEDRH